MKQTQEERNAANAAKGVLTPEQVLQIKMALERGERIGDLADLFNVSYQTIARIKNGQTWRWLKTIGDAAKVAPPVVSAQMKESANESLAKVLASLSPLSQEPSEAELDAPSPLDKHNEQVKSVDKTLEELTRARAAELLGKTDGGLK